jgi:uncharacterized protein
MRKGLRPPASGRVLAVDPLGCPESHNQHTGERAMAHTFEMYRDKAGEYRVRFKYNSEIMFSTEGYSSKASAQNAIDSIKANGPDADIVDNT